VDGVFMVGYSPVLLFFLSGRIQFPSPSPDSGVTHVNNFLAWGVTFACVFFLSGFFVSCRTASYSSPSLGRWAVGAIYIPSFFCIFTVLGLFEGFLSIGSPSWQRGVLDSDPSAASPSPLLYLYLAHFGIGPALFLSGSTVFFPGWEFPPFT